MAEFIGGIMRGLGAALAAIYSATHSYAIAIILLTLGVRALLLPLTIKSTRSMAAMQKAQPEMKKVQQKYKEMQKKARDRVELQQIRMEMNREVQEVMRAHGANPAGGCLPMIAQFPVLIAMFAVMRVSIPVVAPPADAVDASLFGKQQLKSTICRPVDPATSRPFLPSGDRESPTTLRCPTPNGDRDFKLATEKFIDPHSGENVKKAGYIAICIPFENSKQSNAIQFSCSSAKGTGHLPKDSKLFRDVSADHATIFGMHPGCTASQVGSKENVRQCTLDTRGGGTARAIPYYLLIALVVVTSYYSARQLNQRTIRQGGQITPQQQMMSRITPAFFGLISLSLPAGANLYFLTQNIWQIGQQHVQFTMAEKTQAAEAPEPKARPKTEPRPERAQEPEARPEVKRGSGNPHPSSKKKKKRRKKRR